MSKIVKGGTEASPTYTHTATSLMDKALLAVSAPLAVFGGESTEFYSKDDVGVASAVGLTAGFVLGDMFGDKVPVLGGRR